MASDITKQNWCESDCKFPRRNLSYRKTFPFHLFVKQFELPPQNGMSVSIQPNTRFNTQPIGQWERTEPRRWNWSQYKQAKFLTQGWRKLWTTDHCAGNAFAASFTFLFGIPTFFFFLSFYRHWNARKIYHLSYLKLILSHPSLYGKFWC